MTDYKKPEYLELIEDAVGTEPDARVLQILELLHRAPWAEVNTVLDIGMGPGQIARWLSEQGKKVTGTGLGLSSYIKPYTELREKYGIQIEECAAEQMPFPDKSFDAVVMSHVLEHCFNIQLALQEVRRVLADDGWLFVLVPPHDARVFGGHVSVGWSIGQLMFVLLLNGFDVKTGQYARLGPNVAAFVRKTYEPLPPLRGDSGDIHILSEHNLFPLPVKTADGYDDSFECDWNTLNWPWPLDYRPRKSTKMRQALASAQHGIAMGLARIVGRKGRNRLLRLVVQIKAVVSDDCFRDKTRLS